MKKSTSGSKYEKLSPNNYLDNEKLLSAGLIAGVSDLTYMKK